MFPISFISELVGAIIWLVMGVWITWYVVAGQRQEDHTVTPQLSKETI
jgi:hypothetical protein